jgi:hypothetical protein
MYQILIMAALLFADHAAPLGTGVTPEKFETLEACEQARASQTFTVQKVKLAETFIKLGASKGGGTPQEAWIVDRCIQPGQPS